MNEMSFPGNNELVLCGAALCSIVQQHLRDGCYGQNNKNAMRVESVSFNAANSSYRFQLTTDPKRETEQKV